MKIYFYRGTGFWATVIRFFSRSKYAHVSIAFNDGTVYEAAPGKGVRKTQLKSTKGVKPFQTKLGVPLDPYLVKIFCEAELGTPYDYWGVISFLIGFKQRRSKKRYFCSEFVFDACRLGGVPLQDRVEGWQLRPDELAMSPLLTVDYALDFRWRNPIKSPQ